MRKRDKLKNMEQANLMLEQSYLDSKLLFNEENTKQMIKEICANVNKQVPGGMGVSEIYKNSGITGKDWKRIKPYFDRIQFVCGKGKEVDETSLKKYVKDFLHKFYYEPGEVAVTDMGKNQKNVGGINIKRFDTLLRKLVGFKAPSSKPDQGVTTIFAPRIDGPGPDKMNTNM